MTSLPSGFLGVMGLLFFLPPLIVILFKLHFRWGCKKAFGTVVRIERNYDPDSESTRIQPVIHFANESGGLVEIKTGVGYGLRYMPRVNDTVKIYYRPDNPSQFEAASRGLWQVAIVLMATGLILMLPALLLLIVKR